MKIVVGVSGASGAIYAVRLLERLSRRPEAEIHLVLTRAGEIGIPPDPSFLG